MNALEVRDLRKTFRSNFLFRPIPVLRGITLTVGRGESYGFLGVNGAGKTTTIKCLLGLITPDSGTITADGTPLTSKARNRIGFLPENPYFYDYLTAGEYLAFVGSLLSLPRRESCRRADELLRRVSLGNVGSLKLRKFSKGMIQRIGLAAALLGDPELLILDEPFSGLDPIGRKELRDLLLECRSRGKTVFFSSHILQDMELIVDRVGIIHQGQTTREGKLSDLISHSVHSIQIVFAGLSPAAAAAVSPGVVPREQAWEVEVEREADVSGILALILAGKGRVLSVTPQKRTLEEIFLREVQAP
jgi:ABC-2 type transport system ATP-binding protein